MKNNFIDRVSKQIVNLLINDLSGRAGLDNEWNAIDEEIQEEIKQDWYNIISSELEFENDQN